MEQNQDWVNAALVIVESVSRVVSHRYRNNVCNVGLVDAITNFLRLVYPNIPMNQQGQNMGDPLIDAIQPNEGPEEVEVESDNSEDVVMVAELDNEGNVEDENVDEMEVQPIEGNAEIVEPVANDEGPLQAILREVRTIAGVVNNNTIILQNNTIAITQIQNSLAALSRESRYRFRTLERDTRNMAAEIQILGTGVQDLGAICEAMEENTKGLVKGIYNELSQEITRVKNLNGNLVNNNGSVFFPRIILEDGEIAAFENGSVSVLDLRDMSSERQQALRDYYNLEGENIFTFLGVENLQ